MPDALPPERAPDEAPLPPAFDSARFTVRRLFPTPVAVAPVDGAAALNAALSATILARMNATGGGVRSGDGSWQSDDDFADWGGEGGTQLLTLARGLADRLTAVQEEAGLLRAAVAWRVNAWANVSAPDVSELPHHHPGAYWSGVYWVDAGEDGAGGEFEVVDPRGVLPSFHAPRLKLAVPGCLSAGSSDFIAPESGTLLLFPSWLMHAVRSYRGRRQRISVAFNLSAPT